MKHLSQLSVVTCAALISTLALANAENSIKRDFANQSATGNVLATHGWGGQRVVAAKSCAAQYIAYQYSNDAKVSGMGMQFSVVNEYGMSFENVEMPWNLVPPFQPLPAEYNNQLVYGSDKASSKTVNIDGDTLTANYVERAYSGFTGLAIEDTLTTLVVHFDPEFTRVWDMTLSTTQYKLILGNRLPFPVVTTATCDGEFTVTKDEVVNHE